MIKFLGKILGWIILSIVGVVVLVVGIIFFGYILLWVIGIIVGILLFIGFVYLLVKLFGG